MDKRERAQLLARFPEAERKISLIREYAGMTWTPSGHETQIWNPSIWTRGLFRTAGIDLGDAVDIVLESVSAPAAAAARAADAGVRWVYFVCDANYSRSPLAERLLKHRFQTAGLDDVRVASRGRNALSGAPMNPLSAGVLREHGVPF